MNKCHLNKAYESELRLLHDRIFLIGGRSEKMLANAMQALSENDATLAQKTIDYDKTIDRDEMLIDRQCIELLASRQPLGQDLRFIVSVLKMVTYFERLGDLAVKICQRVIKLNRPHEKSTINGLLDMARGVQNMIKITLEAFLFLDTNKAMKVIQDDHAVDEIYHQVTRNYISAMSLTHNDVEAYYHLLSIAKWLERMGDHCTNLAELVIFMIKGEDVRHQILEKVKVSENKI